MPSGYRSVPTPLLVFFTVTRRRTDTPPLSVGVRYRPPPSAALNSRRAPLWQRFAVTDDAARAVWAARRRDHQLSTPSLAVDTRGTSSVHGRRPLHPPTCGRRRHAALRLAGGHVRRGHGRHEGMRTLAWRLLHGAEPPLGARSTAATALRRPPRMLAATGPGAWDQPTLTARTRASQTASRRGEWGQGSRRREEGGELCAKRACSKNGDGTTRVVSAPDAARGGGRGTRSPTTARQRG